MECQARISAPRRQSRKKLRGTHRRPKGELDLLVTLDFRMSTTCLYSDIVLPTATWYEKNDLNTSDMHPFIHPAIRCGGSGVAIAQRLLEIYRASRRSSARCASATLASSANWC